MAKKVNVATITVLGIDELSRYNVAGKSLRSLRSTYIEEKNKVQSKLDETKAERAEELAKDGAILEDVIRTYPIDEYIGKLDSLKVQYDKDCEPYKATQREILKGISENLYPAYALAMKNGNYKATGEYVETKGKGANAKTVKYKVDSTNNFTTIIKDFLGHLGISDLEDEKAMAKVINTVAIRIGGLKKDNETGLLKNKSKSDMRDFLVRATIQYLTEDRPVLTIHENGSITK